MGNSSTPYGTTQSYIPIIAQAQLGRMAGVMICFPSLAALTTAVTAEQGNIAFGSALWTNGQPMLVDAEFLGGSCYRLWRTSEQNARLVVLRSGLTIVLAGDSNTLLFASGAPSGGTGSDGDVSIDWAGNAYYTKASGSWTSAGELYSMGIPIPADNDSTDVVIQATADLAISTADNAAGDSGAINITTGAGGVGHIAERVHIAGGNRGTSIGAQVNIGGGGAGGAALQLYAGYEPGVAGIVDIQGGPVSIDCTSFVLTIPTSVPSLVNNLTLTVALTSNTNLRFSARGSDGVTRVANLTLA